MLRRRGFLVNEYVYCYHTVVKYTIYNENQKAILSAHRGINNDHPLQMSVNLSSKRSSKWPLFSQNNVKKATFSYFSSLLFLLCRLALVHPAARAARPRRVGARLEVPHLGGDHPVALNVARAVLAHHGLKRRLRGEDNALAIDDEELVRLGSAAGH